MEIASIIGARPNFIKAAPVSREFAGALAVVKLHIKIGHIVVFFSKLFRKRSIVVVGCYEVANGHEVWR